MSSGRVPPALAARDLDLARCQQLLTELTAEAVELRRCHQREGINMDYLKNIVVQVDSILSSKTPVRFDDSYFPSRST